MKTNRGQETFYQSCVCDAMRASIKVFLSGNNQSLFGIASKDGELFVYGEKAAKLIDGELFIMLKSHNETTYKLAINAVCAFYNNSRPLYEEADFIVGEWLAVDNFEVNNF